MRLIQNYRKSEADKKLEVRALYSLFFKRIWQHKRTLYWIFGLMFINALIYTAIPFLLKDALQKIYLINEFHYSIALAVGLVLFGSLVALTKERISISFSHDFANNIKKDFMANILDKTIYKFAKVGTGKVMAFMTYNVGLIKALVNDWGLVAIQQMINFLALFIASFFIDERLLKLFLMIVPVFVIYAMVIQWIVRTYALNLMTLNKQIYQNLNQTLNDFAMVKVQNREPARQKSFNRLIDQDLEMRVNRLLIYRYNTIIVQTISVLLIIAFVGLGERFLSLQELNFAEFIFFVLYIHLLFRPFEKTLIASSYFEAGKIGIRSVFPFLVKAKKKGQKEYKLHDNFQGEIEFRDAKYRYPKSKFCLKKINLHLKPGDSVTIVGASNSGKSAFVDTLLHLRGLQHGQLLFDGQRAKHIDPRSIRRNVAVVSTRYLLSNATIHNLLANGDNKKQFKLEQRLLELAQDLGMNEKIFSLGTRRYQSSVTVNDLRFSTTDKLKLALIRAAYQDTPILVLDNFWHSLDEENQEQISTFIKKHCQGKTVIQLSSRSTNLLLETDRQLVLAEGTLQKA